MPGLLIPREQHSDQTLTSFCDVICYQDNDTFKMADTLANETRVKSEEKVNSSVMMYSDNNHHDNYIDNDNCDEDDDATESSSSSSTSDVMSVSVDNYDNLHDKSYDNIISQYDDDINGCSSPILNDCLWSQAALKPFKIIFQELARHRQRSALPPSSPGLTSIKRLGWIWEDEMSFWKNGAKEEFNTTNYSGDPYGESNEVIYSSGSFPDMAMESRIEFKEMDVGGRECSRIKTDCSRRSSLENGNNYSSSGMNSGNSDTGHRAVCSRSVADSSLSPSTDYETDSDVEIDLESNDNNNEYDQSNECNNESKNINSRFQILGNNQTAKNFKISGLETEQNSVIFSTDSGSSVDTRDSKTRKFSAYVDRIHSYSCRSSSRTLDQGLLSRTNSVNKNCAGGGMVSALNTEVIPDDCEPPRNRIFTGQSSVYNGTVSNYNRVCELSSLYNRKRYEIKNGKEFSSSLREELLKKDDRAKRLSMEMYTDTSKYNDNKIVENMDYDYADSYKACSSTSTLSNDDDDNDDDFGSNLTFNLKRTNPYIKQTSCSENVTPYVKKSHSGSATCKFKTLVKSRYRSRGEESERQRRHQHNKLERRRRNGQRNLFGRLEDLIRYHDGRGWGAGEGPPQKMARIHVLVRAARLVRDLQETEKRLEQRLRVLIERNRELRDMCARR